MSVSQSRLDQIYAGSDDPWGFADSAYEQEKFRATGAALLRERYDSALEFGCGNGELARHLAPRCRAYTGLDAVERALRAARRAVPGATFLRSHFPDKLPKGPFDLIVLSEILYFLSANDISDLAAAISRNSPDAEVICVTYLGDTSHELQGQEALDLFAASMAASHRFTPVRRTPHYRMDRGLPGSGR